MQKIAFGKLSPKFKNDLTVFGVGNVFFGAGFIFVRRIQRTCVTVF